MRKTLPILLGLALSACNGAGFGSHAAVPAAPAFSLHRGASAAVNWSVATGATTDHFAVQSLDFYPNNITIDAGDTVTFAVAGGAGGDAHTVAFVPFGKPIPSPLSVKDLAPAGGTTVDGKKFVNSGVLVGGQTFTLSFPKPGTYRILCLFHEPAMEATVVVQKAGTHYPHGAHYYRTISASERKDDLSAALASVALFPFKVGGTTLAAGIDPLLVQFPPSDGTILRFLDTDDPAKVASSGNLKIKAGTVVTFTNETSNEPHTVTLNAAGQKGLPNIPPDPPVNVARRGITKYDGSQVVNSGTFINGKSFKLMFTKAGSYLYGCLYHANSGMEGTITVTP